ncbi:hypothetical protein EYF80_010747 [Liparis tanakae]|uniref:Uncharacterized protein n=1 Tax=Liparis tanakae TaxID=230148 RepID=A0A4Z2IMX7_9TELE|nr:hypothetical protein EYF80_010747 [Liparis tanakae]
MSNGALACGRRLSAASSLFCSPEVRPAVDQVEDLSRVEELLEAPEEFHPLVVTAFGVDKDQEGTGAGRGAGSTNQSRPAAMRRKSKGNLSRVIAVKLASLHV